MCAILNNSETHNKVKHWNNQIRLFAKYFLEHANLPSHKFILLDVGCGTGAALKEIHNSYPHAELFGCDLEEEHVNISIRMNLQYGKFFQSDIMQLRSFYDVIYISNVIEHLPNWQEAVSHLIKCCHRLYILVPYRESLELYLTEHVPGINHVVSFNRKSLSFIDSKQFSIEARVIRTPYAWGHSVQRELFFLIKALFKRQKFNIQREIIFSITNKNIQHTVLPHKPFQNILKSIIKDIMLSI
jgi:SAM-dependent methyltransferase